MVNFTDHCDWIMLLGIGVSIFKPVFSYKRHSALTVFG